MDRRENGQTGKGITQLIPIVMTDFCLTNKRPCNTIGFPHCTLPEVVSVFVTLSLQWVYTQGSLLEHSHPFRLEI